MPDDLRLTPEDAVRAAQRLIDAGRPFHAHEVLEAAWKVAPADQRELWRGLAQIAVGLTHARRGNDRGAVTLLRRGADAIGRQGVGRQGVGGPGSGRPGSGEPAGAVPGRLDPDGVRLAALELADRIERAGLAAVTDDDLRLRLTR